MSVPSTLDDVTLDPAPIAGFHRDLGPTAPEFVAMLIDQFLEEAAVQIQAIHDAEGRSDAAAIKAAAHKLKGSALTMGVRRLGALCAALEVTPIGGGGAAIDREFTNVRVALNGERQEGRS